MEFFFVKMGQLGLHINQGKTKHMIVKRKNSSKRNKIGQLTIQNYTFKRVENFKYLGIIINENNKHQIDLQELKQLTKHTKCYKNFLEIKMYPEN